MADLRPVDCPDLSNADPRVLRKQFSDIVAASPSAIAYLWRGTSADAILPERTPTIEPCEEMASPLRCEAVLSDLHGQLSHLTATLEEERLGKATCDWRQAEQTQNRAWMQYFNEQRAVLEDPYKRYSQVTSFDGFDECDVDYFSLTDDDKRLLASLTLVGRFLKESGFYYWPRLRMTDMFCDNRADCNIISTRALDLLRQSGMPMTNVTVLNLPHHVTLKVQLTNDRVVYFNNAEAFSAESVYRQDPRKQFASWQVMLGNLYDLMGTLWRNDKVAEARNLSLKANEIGTESFGEYAGAARRLHDQGDVDKALATYYQALLEDPGDMSAAYHLHQLELALQKPDSPAGQILKIRQQLSAAKTDDERLALHHSLGTVLYRDGDKFGAMAEYEKALTYGAYSSFLHDDLGHLYLELGDVTRAEGQFQWLCGSILLKAHGHYGLAQVWLKKNKRSRAIRELHKAVAILPNYIEARYALKELRHKTNLIKATEVIENDSSEASEELSHQAKGCALYNQGDFQGALIEFWQALAEKPCAIHYINIGSTLYQLEDVDGAIVAAQSAIASDPSEEMTHNLLAAAFCRKNNVQAAMNAWRAELARNPDEPLSHNGMGMLLSGSGDFQAALSEYQKGNGFFDLGELLLWQGRDESAMAAFQKELQKKPQRKMTHFYMGIIRHNQKDFKGAIAEFQKELAIDPENYAAKYELQKLKTP